MASVGEKTFLFGCLESVFGNSSKDPLFLKLLILFSAPVYSASVKSGSVVAEAALSPNSGYSWLTRKAYKALMVSIFVMQRTAISMRQLWDKDALPKSHPYFMLMEVDFPKNMLFLYSIKDEICTYKDIEKFHMLMKQKGKDVRYRRFEDSPHVEHLRLYPEEYSRLCLEFVEASLEDCVKCKI